MADLLNKVPSQFEGREITRDLARRPTLLVKRILLNWRTPRGSGKKSGSGQTLWKKDFLNGQRLGHLFLQGGSATRPFSGFGGRDVEGKPCGKQCGPGDGLTDIALWESAMPEQPYRA